MHDGIGLNRGSRRRSNTKVPWTRASTGAFGVSSLPVAASKAVSIYATGRVVQLTKIAGFGGRYLASDAQSAAAGGGLATHLHNERGAVMQLVATDAATTASRSIESHCVRLKPKTTRSAV